MGLLKKWYKYVFYRNPFANLEEEEKYVRLLLFKRMLENGVDTAYENWLLEIKLYPKMIWVGMKSRVSGYYFTRNK